jgi:hypothetical protein
MATSADLKLATDKRLSKPRYLSGFHLADLSRGSGT